MDRVATTAMAMTLGGTLVGLALGLAGPVQAEIAEWGCNSDEDCFNPSQPYCDLDSGDCEACLENEHCGPDEVCHGHECIVACTGDLDCSDPTGHCTEGGICVECTDDAHCVGDAGLCISGADYGECVACIIDEDCLDEAAPWCQPSNHTCVECLGHADCPEEEYCSANSCVPDACVPGELTCNANGTYVLECDEFGIAELGVEPCPDGDCVDGACGGGGGGDTGSTTGGDADTGDAGSGSGDEAGGDGTGADAGVGDEGGAPLTSRGCGCASEPQPSPFGALGLSLLALFGLRRRRA